VYLIVCSNTFAAAKVRKKNDIHKRNTQKKAKNICVCQKKAVILHSNREKRRMTLLCIETSTAVCSAAVCRDGQLLKQLINREGSNHARLLPLYIDELLAYVREQGLTIDAVALSEGPGSYTGLRIGTSMAKGLCYGLNVPLIPVPTLEVLCEAAKESLTSNSPKDGLTSNSAAVFIPMIDARRMEVYTMVDGETKAVVVENESSLSSDNAAVFYYFGDGAAKCQEVIKSPNWHYIPDIVPEARYVGVLAEQSPITHTAQADRKNHQSPINIAYYEPFYLKEFVAAQSHVKGLV
jgi:tRNA threonylcarbamoyladenosine biosynthesis protein TsaB